LNSREILKRLVRRFGLLVLLMLIGGLAGAVYSAVKTPTYTAKAYVVAIGDPGEAITALNFAQAYGRIATSGPVQAAAGVRLGADKSGLADVTSSTSPDAPVIEVTATSTAAQHAADLVNAVAVALAEYGSSRKTETHVSLALLAGATTPASPSSPKPPLELAVGAAGGLLIGGLAVLAGVGRASAARERAGRDEDDTASVRYEAEVDEGVEVDEPAAGPAEIERYLGVARAAPAPKAITSYHASAAPTYLTPDTDDDVAPDPPGVARRVVGRAVVAGTEDQ
jgi:capsular polysaccharide biosynthesis protein